MAQGEIIRKTGLKDWIAQNNSVNHPMADKFRKAIAKVEGAKK